MTRALHLALALAALGPICSAQITTVCSETFEYPIPGVFHGMTGGTGWSNAWFVTGGANDDIRMFDNTMTPMFATADAVGGHAGQVATWGAGYRQIDVGAHQDLLDTATNMWGRDGATIWVSFSAVAYQGTPTQHFGGLSLWRAGQAQPEALLLGCPWDDGAWGIDDEGPVGALGVVVPGTDDSIAARLVYRIDCMPGDERIRLWVDPMDRYPTGPADLDTTIVDLRFNEIRISAGGNNGDLYMFDAIEIAKGTPSGSIGTNYCTAVTNSTGTTGTIVATGSRLAAQNDVTLTAIDLPSASFGFFLTSQMQAQVVNPGGSTGNLCLGGAIGRYVGPGQIKNTGSTGQFSLVLDLTQTPTPIGPVSVLAGETWNFQGWHRDAVGGMATSNFTDGVEVVFI